METALALVVGTVVVVAGTVLGRWVRVPAPLVLVLVGVGASYLPFVPRIELSPEVVLIGLLPPLLYSAAIRTSLVDFRANRLSIGLLSVGATLFTTVCVAFAAWWIVPEPFSLAAAFALGAVVAPPDAVAATAVARRMGLPRRVVSILEGESLVNDATALVALNTARAAIVAPITVWAVAEDFIVAAVGGVVVGAIVAAVVAMVRRRIDDPVLDTAVSFVTPFIAFIIAEKAHASGVLAVVVAGLWLGHQAHRLQSGASRLAEQSTWRTVQFLLENAVFLLIGLQLPIVVSAAREEVGGGDLAVISAVVLAVVLVSRIVWVHGSYGTRVLLTRIHPVWGLGSWSSRSATVVSWAGMRGVVSIAAAFALPEETPRRGVLLFVTFAVVVGTLGVQGLSLPWLARRLRLPGPDVVQDALARAALLHEVTAAGRAQLDREVTAEDSAEVVEGLRQSSQQRADEAWERLGRSQAEYEPPTATYVRLRLAMLTAERDALVLARDSGRYEDEVLRLVALALDVEESLLDRTQVVSGPVALPANPEDSARWCEHLVAASLVVRPRTPEGCETCLVEGTTWVHLRLCVTCGYVGCCSSSPEQHAERHFQETGHPVMRSFEPHEQWRWCYVHHLLG
ncbi:MAG: Na+/H+ antiporter [Actinomycetota bacterium]